MRTARVGCITTILPRSLPAYLAKSASLPICTRTTSLLMVPAVEGEKLRGAPMSMAGCGSTIAAEKRWMVQPWPNAHRSWCTLLRPQSRNCFMAQSLACANAGVPVTRGP